MRFFNENFHIDTFDLKYIIIFQKCKYIIESSYFFYFTSFTCNVKIHICVSVLTKKHKYFEVMIPKGSWCPKAKPRNYNNPRVLFLLVNDT